jgi:hypothetical protein
MWRQESSNTYMTPWGRRVFFQNAGILAFVSPSFCVQSLPFVILRNRPSPRRLVSPPSLSSFPIPFRFRLSFVISACSVTQFLFRSFSIVDFSSPLSTLDLRLGAIDAQGRKRNFASTLDPQLPPPFVFYSLIPLFPIFCLCVFDRGAGRPARAKAR